MKPLNRWQSVLEVVALLYGVATIASVVTILLLTQDIETIGVGFLMPLFTLPAIILQVLLKISGFSIKVYHITFWILFLPMPLWMLWIAFSPTPGAQSDGADQLATLLAIPLLTAGTAAYLVSLFWRKYPSN